MKGRKGQCQAEEVSMDKSSVVRGKERFQGFGKRVSVDAGKT